MAITAINPKKFLGANNPFTPMGPATEDSAIAPEFGATPSSSGTFSSAISSPAIQPNLRGTKEFQEYSDVADKLRQALNPNPVSTPRALLGALISRRNPMLGSVITGDYQRQRAIQPLMQQEELLSNQLKMGRELENQRISNEEKQAQTGYLNAHAAAVSSPAPKGAQDKAIDDLVGTPNPDNGGKPYTYADAFSHIQDSIQGAKITKPPVPTEEDKAISDLLGAKGKPNTPANRDAARSTLKTRDRPAKDPDIADLGKQIKQAQLEKLKEATPDEQRRADLANNLEENLNNLEDIAKRRPELFGPMAGRMTGLRQTVGSSDPDVAALKVIEEQTGLAMVGAHAMRNAQHAEKAAQSITGANHNTASALLAPNGPIARARESVATFKADANRRRNAIGAPSGGTYQRPSPNVVVEQ